MIPILTVPEAKLRQKSAPVERLTLEIQAQIKELADTMKHAHDPEGVGLSFPQIGILTRGFVTYLDGRMKVYLNPEILDMSEEKTLGGSKDKPTLEGCLSIPWLYGPVWRAKKIKVRAIDEHGSEFTKTLSSFPARLVQHEFDHLEGILFTDYTLKDNQPLYFLEKEKDEFIEIKDPAKVIKW